jgi:hypothetical protein
VVEKERLPTYSFIVRHSKTLEPISKQTAVGLCEARVAPLSNNYTFEIGQQTSAIALESYVATNLSRKKEQPEG